MMFCEETDKAFERLNPLICKYYEPNHEFFIVEVQQEGKAEIHVRSRYPCFHVQNIDKKRFPVLKPQKCADHLVFQFCPDTNTWSLHIFELTRSIHQGIWESKIIPQFDGALLNAYAILGVLHIWDFSEMYVHCGYRKNKSENSTVDRRAMLGKPAPADWLNGAVMLPPFPGIRLKNVPIRLDEENGCGEFFL